MEYSFVVTPVTVCVSRIFGGLLVFLVWSSDLWYAKVKGGSPLSVNRISAWSPETCLSVAVHRLHVTVTRTFMNILQHPLSIANLCGRHRVNSIVKVRHSCLAHRLLVSHGGDHEFPRSLQSQREWRTPRLLAVGFSIDTIP